VPGFSKKLFTIVLTLAVFHVGIANSSAFRLEMPGIYHKGISDIESSSAALPAQDSVSDPLSQQLQEARQLQAIGEYEKAVQAYQALLDTAPADSPERAEASFLLGETQYLAGHYTEAVDAFLFLQIITRMTKGTTAGQSSWPAVLITRWVVGLKRLSNIRPT